MSAWRHLVHFLFGCRSQRAYMTKLGVRRGLDLSRWPVDFCRDCGARLP